MVINEDIYKNNVILIKKGTKVTVRVKELLKKWAVTEVSIKQEKKDGFELKLNEKERKKKSKLLFQKALPLVADEFRYGFALHDDKKLLWIESLFIKLVSQPNVFNAINRLKRWDEYSYLHSIDVFILGALFAKKVKLLNVETFALGCLLHDIGKLEISKELLQKKGMLTTKEFNEIKRHVNYGANWLQDQKFDRMICDLAKSHHERRDGSGYPEQLTKEQLTREIDMLNIIDVYSALTLKRSYHEGRTAISAIKVFINEGKKFNDHFVKQFLEMLKIFPKSSMVILSNKKKARILYVNEKQPFLPLVEVLDTKETFQIPINYSIFITKLIDFEVTRVLEKSQLLWEDYISALTKGRKKQAIDIFDELIDNRQIEDIYINIFSKSMELIGDRWIERKVSIAEEHVASFITKEILNYFKFKTIPIPTDDRPKIACMTVEGDMHTLPLKIAVDMLEAKGWKVYNLENTLPAKDLVAFLEANSIKKLGISISYTGALKTLNKTISEIRSLNDKITIIIGGSAADQNQINDYDLLISDMEKFDELIV